MYFSFSDPFLTFRSFTAVSAKALCSVGHFDAKHFLLLISADNKRSVLVRMQLEIIGKKMFQYTRNTNKSPHCSNFSLCILVEFEVLATDVSDATDDLFSPKH